MIATCTKCSGPFEVFNPGTFACPHCRTLFEFFNNDFQDFSNNTIPWEQNLNLVNFFKTLKQVLVFPKNVLNYKWTKNAGDSPLAYGIITNSIGFFLSTIYALFLNEIFLKILVFLGFDIAASISLGLFIILMVAAPIIAIISIYISSLFYHFFLYMLAPNPKEFTITRNIVCYFAGSASVLQVVPFLGSLASLVYGIYLLVMGFSKVHNISRRRALLVIILPFIVFLFCLFSMVSIVAMFSFWAKSQLL